MDELIKTFHIDWKLLIAQVINFAIVLGVLWYFALRPLMNVMRQRSKDIGQSLADAEAIEKKLEEADVKKEQIVTEAKKQSQIILEQANKNADTVRQNKLAETRQEMEKIAAKTKQELQAEKDRMITEAKAEVAGLVIAAAEKVASQTLDEEKDRELVENAIKQVRS